MELDELKEAWAAHGRLLERTLAVDERLLREVLAGKIRRRLAPYVVLRALEVALGAGALCLAVPVLVAHVAEPRYALVAGAVVLFAAAMTALCAYLLVNALQLDHGGPVTAIQREVERLRLAEYRALKWAVLGGTLLWLPIPLVLFEGLTGVEALARVDLAWLGANLAVGLGLLALGQVLSRKHVERDDLGPLTRRLVDALSSRSLRAVEAHLDELARFERDEAPTVRARSARPDRPRNDRV